MLGLAPSTSVPLGGVVLLWSDLSCGGAHWRYSMVLQEDDSGSSRPQRNRPRIYTGNPLSQLMIFSWLNFCTPAMLTSWENRFYSLWHFPGGLSHIVLALGTGQTPFYCAPLVTWWALICSVRKQCPLPHQLPYVAGIASSLLLGTELSWTQVWLFSYFNFATTLQALGGFRYAFLM